MLQFGQSRLILANTVAAIVHQWWCTLHQSLDHQQRRHISAGWNQKAFVSVFSAAGFWRRCWRNYSAACVLALVASSLPRQLPILNRRMHQHTNKIMVLSWQSWHEFKSVRTLIARQQTAWKILLLDTGLHASHCRNLGVVNAAVIQVHDDGLLGMAILNLSSCILALLPFLKLESTFLPTKNWDTRSLPFG